MSPDNALDLIAVATQAIAASVHALTATLQSLAETQHALREDHRSTRRLHAYALSLMGLSVLGIAFLVWQHLAYRHDAILLQRESQALQELILHNDQIIAAQTQAILERLERP